MAKTFVNLLWNQKSNDPETWHRPLWSQVLQNSMNDNPGLTLTYFTVRLTLVKIAYCAGSKPNSQVSIYRTIGPRVFLSRSNFRVQIQF